MCPVCIATATLIALSATGAGGLTVLAVHAVTKRQAPNPIPEQTKTKEDRHG